MMPSFFGLYTTNDYQDRQAIHDMFFMEIWLRGTTLTRFSDPKGLIFAAIRLFPKSLSP